MNENTEMKTPKKRTLLKSLLIAGIMVSLAIYFIPEARENVNHVINTIKNYGGKK